MNQANDRVTAREDRATQGLSAGTPIDHREVSQGASSKATLTPRTNNRVRPCAIAQNRERLGVRSVDAG
jgi:hypothetical protein